MTIEELATKKRLPLLVPSALLMHSTLHREKKRKKINTKEKGMVHRQRWVSQIKKRNPGFSGSRDTQGKQASWCLPRHCSHPFCSCLGAASHGPLPRGPAGQAMFLVVGCRGRCRHRRRRQRIPANFRGSGEIMSM